VRELSEWLTTVPPEHWSRPTWKQTPLRVAVHTPCSQRHGLRSSSTASTVLRQLPGVNLVTLPESTQLCCGAAGSYAVRRAHDSAALFSQAFPPETRMLIQQTCDCVVTTNLGCERQLDHGLGVRVQSLSSLVAERLATGAMDS